jgi:hypothetical protein
LNSVLSLAMIFRFIITRVSLEHSTPGIFPTISSSY